VNGIKDVEDTDEADQVTEGKVVYFCLP